MSSDPARRLATYDDVLAAGDERVEVIGGQFETLPSARPRHGRVARAIAGAIGGPFDDDDGRGGPGGWWILTEVDVRLSPHDIVRPDVAGWRKERLTDLDTLPIDVRPDWVCEVLSPGTRLRDTRDKRRLFASAGISHYWLLDPDDRTLLALVLEADRWIEQGLYAEGDLARIAPFEALELDVGRLFPPTPTP
jgi:Uma2 family endonuclease